MSDNQTSNDPYALNDDIKVWAEKEMSKVKIRDLALTGWFNSVLALPDQDEYEINFDQNKIPNSLELPAELYNEIIEELPSYMVMYNDKIAELSEEEFKARGTKDGHRINTLTLSLEIKEEDITKDLEPLINDMVDSFVEGIAVNIDQLMPTSFNVNSMIGILPNNMEDPDNKVPDEFKAIREAVTVIDKLHTDITVKDLKVVKSQYIQMFGEESAKRASWYLNSNTGLGVACIKNKDDSFWLDGDEAIATVGVPDTLMDNPIIYNEWMDDLNQNRGISIIYGALENVYRIGLYPKVSVIRGKNKKNDDGDDVIEIIAIFYITGDVDLSKKVNGKLPYIGLRTLVDDILAPAIMPGPPPRSTPEPALG